VKGGAPVLPQSYFAQFRSANTALTLKTEAANSEEIDYAKLSKTLSLEQLVAYPNATMEQYIKTGLTWKQMQRLLSDPRNSAQHNYYILRLFVTHLGFNYLHVYKFFNLLPQRDMARMAELIKSKEIDLSRSEWAVLIHTGNFPTFLGLTYVDWMNVREV